MSAQKLPVLIIGAGISGLTLARLLTKNAIPNIIFEATPRLSRQGYGITARSWAYEPLLKQLEVSSADFKAKTATDSAIGGEGKLDLVLYDLSNGQPLVKPPKSKTGSPDGDKFRTNRNYLRQFLMENVDVQYQHELIGVEIIHAEKGKQGVIATFQNGLKVEGSCLVGADGVHSYVRKTFLPNSNPKIGSTTMYLGERTMRRADFDTELRPFFKDNNVQVALADNAIVAITAAELGYDEVSISWFYSRLSSPEGPDLPSQHLVGTILTAQVLQDLAKLGEMGQPFSTFLKPEQVQQDKLYNWKMRTVDIKVTDLEKLVSKGIALIGDAAHAMPIFAGEGGNHAVVDGIELAEELSKDSSTDSILEFVKRATPRWRRAIDGSEKDSLAMHQPIQTGKAIAAKQEGI